MRSSTHKSSVNGQAINNMYYNNLAIRVADKLKVRRCVNGGVAFYVSNFIGVNFHCCI